MKSPGYRSGSAGGVSCAPSASSAEEFDGGTGFSSNDSEGGSYDNSNAIGPYTRIGHQKAEFHVATF
jgi:hypothetical protein